jgi:hypothetical protein
MAKGTRPGGVARPGFAGSPPAISFPSGHFSEYRGGDRYRGDRDHRRSSRHNRHLLPAWGFGYWGDGDGYAESEPRPDMFGFFGAGGAVALIDGQAVYEYDRSYPYEWFSGNAAAPRLAAKAPAQDYRCERKVVPDGDGNRQVAVRVCRR